MVDTKGQLSEPKPMAIKAKLHSKQMGGSPRGFDSSTWGGGVGNKIGNQLIIPYTVPTTYCQIVNTKISTVDEVEEGILDSRAPSHCGECKSET